MRPVFRGTTPLDALGNPKTVSDYKDWRADLIDRIGNYCSYCNMVLNDSPQVEHVTPKNPQVGQTQGSMLDWDNMLLACGPCNRAKDNNPCPTTTHFLPDFHNTHLAFEHIVFDVPQKPGQKACVLMPKVSLTQPQLTKAQNTIDLCKLDKIVVNPRATDLRWKYRYEALLASQFVRESWDRSGKNNAADFLPLLNIVATAKGFFSVWYTTFQDVPVVLQSLINAFPNTVTTCFDAANGYSPVPRTAIDL